MKKGLKIILAVHIALTVAIASAADQATINATAKSKFEVMPAGAYAKVTQTANIRSGKGKKYKVVGTMKKGKYVKVYKIYYNDKESWSQIKYKGKKAYISTKLLYINAG